MDGHLEKRRYGLALRRDQICGILAQAYTDNQTELDDYEHRLDLVSAAFYHRRSSHRPSGFWVALKLDAGDNMVIDWQTAERIQCSTEERRQVVPLIETIMRLAEEARTEGLLTLEDRIDSLEPPILALGVQLVVDGTDPDRINEILTARILSANASGRTLLEQLIARWGILEIQAGDNPRVIKTQCFAFLGEDADELQRELDATLDERERRIVEEFSNIDGRVEDTFADMDKLLRLDRRAIQKVLREIDTSRLSCALHGARSAVRGKIVVNISKNSAARLATEGSDSSPKAVRESVSIVLSIIAKLAEHGEIPTSQLDLQE